MNKKKVLIISLCLALVLSLVPFSFADTKSDLTNLQSEIDQKNAELSKSKAKANSLASQIKSLEKEIYADEVSINKLETNINDTKAEITKTLEELELKQVELSKQHKDLNDRFRAMYKNGEIGMLSVLLGSANMSDFMTNMDMIQRIYDADANLLAELQAEYSVINDTKEHLLTLKETLITQQEDLEAKQAGLTQKKTNVSEQKKLVDADTALLEDQLDAMNAEADALIQEILAMQGVGDYIGGTMCWPSKASTRITSKFGMRYHPIYHKNKMHTGIDIGAAGGTDILAANAGVVISAGWNNAYGYMVMIDHGGGIVTLYAHSSKLLVAKGDVVSRGQTIAKVGSTGNSTGNHLHFEVRVNGQYQDPMNYVSTSVRK